MRQIRHRSWHRPWPLLAAIGSLALLLTVVIADAGVAAAAPTAPAAGSTFAVTEVPFAAGSPNSVAVDPDTNDVYAGIDNDQAVAVIDGTSNAETALISLPNFPNTVAVDPATDTVYAIAGQNTAAGVDVIDGATNAITTTISLPSTLFASAAAVNPMTDMLYIADENDGTVIVIDGSTDTVAATIPLADSALDPNPSPRGIAVDTATNMIYVADDTGDQVEVIDGTTNEVTDRIALPAKSGPTGVAADPAAGLVYVSELGTGSIAAIDTATDGLSTLAGGLDDPAGLALDAGTGTLYATSNIGSVDSLSTTYVIDTATGAIDAQIPRGGASAAVLATGGPVYVDGANAVGGLDDDVTVITPSTVNTMSPVIVGSTGFTFTVGQAGQGQLTASATPAATFAATGMPAWLSVSSSGLVSGTPPAGTGGNYPIVITAANGVAPAATTTGGVTVDQPPAITSASQVTFQAGVAGSFTMTATGWPGPTFSETGALPAGVTLYSSGVLSGTPAAGTAGVYSIQVTASNGVGTAATQAFTLTVAPPSAVAIGAEGTDGALWVQAPQLAAGWQSLGGQITGAPAVAAPPNPDGTTPADPVFFATGSNEQLWVRSLTSGWQPAGPSTAYCIGSPAAVVTSDGTLTVACEGLNRQLWYDTTTMPSSGLPSFTTGWASLGGILSAGPAVAPVGGVLTFFAEGTTGQVFTSTGAGFTGTSWDCIGTLAAATQAATGVTTFGCQGGDHSLWTATNDGTGWSAATSLGGQLTGGPGIAAASGATEFFVEGTDGAVWEWTSGGGWTSLGGDVTGGAGATALN